MATAPATTGAPTRAPSNVVRLPTAAARKVQNPMNRTKRAAKAELPQFTGEHLFPSQRKAMETAELLTEVRQSLSPEMEILTALIELLDNETRFKLMPSLIAGKINGRRSAAQALAVVKSARMTVGEALDLSNALRRLEGARA